VLRRRLTFSVVFFALLMLQPAISVLAEDGPTDADLKAGYCLHIAQNRAADMCARASSTPQLDEVYKKFCRNAQNDDQRLKDYLAARGYLFGPRDPTPIMVAGSRGDADLKDCKESTDHPTPELASCEKKCDIHKSDWSSCITGCAPDWCRRLWSCNDLTFLPF
jgi:hypothetical protein